MQENEGLGLPKLGHVLGKGERESDSQATHTPPSTFKMRLFDGEEGLARVSIKLGGHATRAY